MIRHIVTWKLKAEDPAQKAVDAEGVRSRLEALVGTVPGLQALAVRPDIGVDGNWDLVLVSDHDSVEALDGYRVHPEHRKATEFVQSVAAQRAAVDIEL